MSRKLTILHTESSCGWGGQEIRILTEMAGMNARGHHTILICPAESNIFREGKKRGLETYALPVAKKRLRGALALRKWLSKHKVDVINTHSSTDSWLAAVACQTLSKAPPIVRTRHVSAPINNKSSTRWLYQTATKYIVTTGERLKETLVRDNGFDANRIESVTTGIDTRRFVPGDKAAARKQLGLPADAPVIGIVATMRGWKGHSYLLQAFAQLPFKQARLLMVGHGPQFENLQSQARELQIGDRVIMPGNQEDVVSWLQAMDVFALPSWANEGVPQALLQAMLAARPIVTTSVGSISEAISDGSNGIIVPTQNAEALHQALLKLLEQPAYAEKLGQAARATALEKFGFDRMIDRMEKIFHAISN
ncbi:MAG: glycosyltransferase family 4 protein [Chitinivorax sp.]